jgi:hypothetical protein
MDPVRSLVTRARAVVLDALEAKDVEGHLAAVVLRHAPHDWLTEPVARLLAAPPPGLGRSSDVAIVGLRNALGVKPPDSAALGVALRRELGRQPLKPATRAHDDERLMLGVAAGVGAVPDLIPTMMTEFGIVRALSPRWDAVLLWAKALAAGEWDAPTVAAAERLVATAAGPIPFGDAVVVLALAADLFDTHGWKPDDRGLAAVERATDTARRVVVLDAPEDIEPLDAAVVLRGLAAQPAEQFHRRSALDAVLATVEAFPAALQILSNRPRNRAGVPRELEDEYDVQWLLHALLLPAIPDLVDEDTAPKLAGAGSRLDFTSRGARLGIEVKHLRERKHVGRMREELMVDERQYQEHPYVETVVGFVHDPHQHITLAERATFERDLSVPVTVAGRTVNYVVRVR